MAVFFRRGQSNATFVLTMAGAAPTSSEITSGVDISKAVLALTGFDTSLNRINTPVLDYAQEIQVDGPQTFGDASITIADDDASGAGTGDSAARIAARTALAEGVSGYLVLSPQKRGKPTTADKVDVWPIKIGAVNRDYSLDAQLARTVIQCAITGAPAKNVAVG